MQVQTSRMRFLRAALPLHELGGLRPDSKSQKVIPNQELLGAPLNTRAQL